MGRGYTIPLGLYRSIGPGLYVSGQPRRSLVRGKTKWSAPSVVIPFDHHPCPRSIRSRSDVGREGAVDLLDAVAPYGSTALCGSGGTYDTSTPALTGHSAVEGIAFSAIFSILLMDVASLWRGYVKPGLAGRIRPSRRVRSLRRRTPSRLGAEATGPYIVQGCAAVSDNNPPKTAKNG